VLLRGLTSVFFLLFFGFFPKQPKQPPDLELDFWFAICLTILNCVSALYTSDSSHASFIFMTSFSLPLFHGFYFNWIYLWIFCVR